MAKEQGWQLEAALNNDIVGGNRTPGDTLQNNNWVRVFSESTARPPAEADIPRIRAIGGENDFLPENWPAISLQWAKHIISGNLPPS